MPLVYPFLFLAADWATISDTCTLDLPCPFSVLSFLSPSGLGDPAGPGLTVKTGGRGSGRAGGQSQGPASPAGGLSTPGGKKDRVPNHWWELELTAEGPMLYPTSNCHEWTSDNGIEHRIMEIEFQHGCEVGVVRYGMYAVVWGGTESYGGRQWSTNTVQNRTVRCEMVEAVGYMVVAEKRVRCLFFARLSRFYREHGLCLTFRSPHRPLSRPP